MMRMKKEIIYLLEYLSKSEKNDEAMPYQEIVLALEEILLYAPSTYSQNKLQTLIKHNGFTLPNNFNEAINLLDSRLKSVLPSVLVEAQKMIFHTLLMSNFAKKKPFLEHSIALFESQLEPVEMSIYQHLSAYVKGFNRALSLFAILGEKSPPEKLIAYAQIVHVKLMEQLFNEEERRLLSSGLHKLMAVYVSLYGKYMYENML